MYVGTVVLFSSVTVGAVDLSDVKSLLDEGKFQEAIMLLVRETEENPAHEAARIKLAEAYEKAGMPEQAIETWRELMAVSRQESNLHEARKALARLRRRHLDQQGSAQSAGDGGRKDPFKIPMPPVDWEGLDVVEDTRYLPPIPGHEFEVPPFPYETKHFTVYSTNERLSKVIGERAEAYLDFVIDKLFAGRAWALRFPIIVYRDRGDYQQHGGPEGTGGVTGGHITGKTEKILLYQLQDGSTGGSRGRGRSAGAGKGLWKYGVESVLPHELTHAVINEFFAGRPTPRWLHEAIAGRFEQTRDHYGEAARLARKVVAGEYFRMRDLFDQPGYPVRIELFYEQSAAVVLYLFEAGAEAMHAFLTELAAGNGHDAACAAALGIPVENAVEEFERRWVEWMKVRYIEDLDRSADDTQTAEATAGERPISRPWVNEKDTVSKLTEWRTLNVDSLAEFSGVARAAPGPEWSVEKGLLRCAVRGENASSVLAIRVYETPPLAVRCKVRCVAGPDQQRRWVGFTQLDARGYDTRAEVLAPLPGVEEHELVCLWSDDLAVYLDGTCVGRYPAALFDHGEGGAAFPAGAGPSRRAGEIDFPLAITAYAPVEIRDLQIAPIKEFSNEPVGAAADEGTDRGRRNATRREGRERRRRGP